jgi:hypothetical protein
MGLAFACGGGSGGGPGGNAGSSGVDPSKQINELTDDEVRDLCDYFGELQESPERTVDCGDGNTITIGINPDELQMSIDSCVAEIPRDTCTATVAEAEMCFETLDTTGLSDAEVCAIFMSEDPPAGCDALFNDPNCQ